MEFKCNACDRNFDSEESLKQHNLAKHAFEKKKGKTSMRKYLIISIIVLIIILTSITINSYMKKPGEYDDFTKCLTQQGVVVYGNDFCTYTAQQLNYFGKSKQFLNYVKCIDNKQLCDSKGVSITPTWEINGEMYEQVQGFEKLAQLSGCEL